ncbi:MAG: leucine-rich repeat protein, partial [Clostridiales bacterium]|nr:leucine-rich repeat protein [Clostridiales bacterium]
MEEVKKIRKKPTTQKNVQGKIFILSRVLAAVIVAIAFIVTLTACNSESKIKKYTVTFDTMGGSEIQSYTLNEGDKIKRPKTNPTKNMFTFDDWYWENPNKSGEKQKFVFDTAISQNITLIAGWRGDTSVKIEFNANGGAFENEKEVVMYGLIGSTMSAPTDVPTRYGYKFDGWYVDEECYNAFNFGTFPTNNATLYAGWGSDPEFGYVSYYGNGELLRTEPVKKTDKVVIPDLFDDSDIVVGDWYTDAEMTKSYTADKPTDALALYTTYYTDGLTFNKGVVTGYNGTATSVVVPSKYNGTTISSIGDDAFYWTKGLTAITSVKLPDTIHTIGNGAFYNCQYLASIDLTEKVTTIGADAFYRNERLRTLGDISGLETIGDYAFNGCKELRDFEFGNLLRVIGNYAFNDCVSLTEVTLTYSVQWIGDYAFSGCTSLKTVVAESLV